MSDFEQEVKNLLSTIAISYDCVPMSSSTCACLWLLLGCLVASDTNLPWASLRTAKAVPKSKSATRNDSNAQKLNVRNYVRLAAYVAIMGLLWSLSISTAQQQQPYPPEPSARAEHDALLSNDEENYTPPSQANTSDEMLYGTIQNETLGFEKIFVINLPERADKRDALSLTAALTNIKLTWTSALRGTSVPDKALPLGVDRAGWRDGGIGSWRSQMNVIRTMVEENIASALILEDDADWDVRLKDQLEFIAQGTRLLLDRAHEEDAFETKLTSKQRQVDDINSPYGDGWDILWLGHCGETFPERIPGHHVIQDRSSARYTYYAMEDDDTLPTEPADVTESWISGDLSRHKGTRWVHFSGGPTCSQAYALSQSGARKVLLALSVGGTLIEQLDNAMSHLCRDHTPWDSPDDLTGPPGYPGANMRCLSVNPAVFSQHKPRGRKAAGSDIETLDDGDEMREEGESPNLVLSARLNVQNLMMGRPLQEQRIAAGKDRKITAG